MERWRRNLYVTWIGQVLSLSGFGFMIPFIPYFIQEVGVTDPDAVRRWVGLTTSVTAIGMGVMAPIWGSLADRFGRKLMILRSIGAGSVILLLMSRAQSVEAIFVLRMAQGLLTGTITAAATLVAAGTPPKRLSYALGFLSSSTFIGLSIGPFFGGLAAEYFGYRRAFVVGSIVLAVDFVIVLLLIQDVRHKKAAVAGGEAGDTPDGRKRRRTVLLNPKVRVQFAVALVLLLLIRFTRGMPVSFVPLHVQEVRGTIEGSAAVMGVISALLGVAAATAGLTIARLGDRFDKVRLVGVLALVSAAIAGPIFFTRGLVGFTILYVAAAFTLGGVEPNLQSYVSEHTDPSRRGVMFGLQTLLGSIGWFLAPLVGSLISIRLSIPHIFILYALVLCAVFVISWFVNPRTSRRSGSHSAGAE